MQTVSRCAFLYIMLASLFCQRLFINEVNKKLWFGLGILMFDLNKRSIFTSVSFYLNFNVWGFKFLIMLISSVPVSLLLSLWLQMESDSESWFAIIICVWLCQPNSLITLCLTDDSQGTSYSKLNCKYATPAHKLLDLIKQTRHLKNNWKQV